MKKFHYWVVKVELINAGSNLSKKTSRSKYKQIQIGQCFLIIYVYFKLKYLFIYFYNPLIIDNVMAHPRK